MCSAAVFKPPPSVPVMAKWTLGDSNPGPTGYEPGALTN